MFDGSEVPPAARVRSSRCDDEKKLGGGGEMNPQPERRRVLQDKQQIQRTTMFFGPNTNWLWKQFRSFPSVDLQFQEFWCNEVW